MRNAPLFWIASTALCGSMVLAGGCRDANPIRGNGDRRPSVTTTDASTPEESTEGKEPVSPQAIEQASKITKKSNPVTGFSFQSDAAGKRLGELLIPEVSRTPDPFPRLEQRERLLPTSVQEPRVPFASPNVTIPRLRLPTNTPIFPTSLPERPHKDLAKLIPDLPPRDPLPEGKRTAILDRDINRPAKLPMLARPTPDRAPLDDPSSDFSARTVIAERLPLRETPSPFVRILLPIPFEFVGTITFPATGAEDPQRSLGSPPLPMR